MRVILSVLAAIIALGVCSPAWADCPGSTKSKYTGEDCGQWSKEYRIDYDYDFDPPKIELPLGIKLPSFHIHQHGIYRSDVRSFIVGPSASPISGDTDPECHANTEIGGVYITHWSSCVTFCVDNVSLENAVVTLYGGDSNGDSREWSCFGQPVCEWSYASARRNNGACAEFRNWSDNLTRRFTIEVRRKIRD